MTGRERLIATGRLGQGRLKAAAHHKPKTGQKRVFGVCQVGAVQECPYGRSEQLEHIVRALSNAIMFAQVNFFVRPATVGKIDLFTY